MNTPSRPVPVAVLGATGTVGARIIARLAAHPWFELVEVAASERSAGRTLGESLDGPEFLPPELAELRLSAPDGPFTAPLILSALPKTAAETIETKLAAKGHLVVSNASAHRMTPSVPLVIPEVNPAHADLLGPRGKPTSGILTNPNCVAVPLTMALAPLHEAFGLDAVIATTFQAISGAGLPGPSAIHLVDNVLPRIEGEEEKIRAEPKKILGILGDGEVRFAEFEVSATSTRVPVLHGHLIDVSVRLRERVPLARAVEAMRSWRGRAAALDLPSLPARPLEVTVDPDRPQPRLDRDAGGGMAVTVGRIRECPVNGIRFVVLAHNLERGAAGAAVANAELMVRTGRVPAHGEGAAAVDGDAPG